MSKKIISLMTVFTVALSLFTGCSSSTTSTNTSAAAQQTETTEQAPAATEEANTEEAAEGAEETSSVDASGIKVGVIYVGDENEGYTAAHMAGIDEMMAAFGLSEDQVIEKTNIAEDESCYDAAADLADSGCNIIFATSFGHEDYLMRVAQEYPEVECCHATGFKAASSGLSNMHNYFDSIYEARYVSGVVAGMKLKEMIDNGTITAAEAKLGYIGAYPYAEVISGFTAFYLGAKSIVDEATMEVSYTNSWADPSLEGETATALIADGCKLISQHADTTGAPSVCETAGVPIVGYNVDMTTVAPNVALTSPTNDWGVYYTHAVDCVLNGKPIETDWCQGYAEDSVAITPLGSACAAGTQEKVDEVIAAIKEGSLHVFDTSKFTVEGKPVESFKNDAGQEFISDGYFHESEYGSAPAFSMIIDGITVK